MLYENVGKGWQLADVWCILMGSELSDAKQGSPAMKTTKTIQNTLNLRHQPIAFVDGTLAKNYAANCIKPHRVMLGCDGKFWIVCPADAETLARNGYQYA